MNFLYRINKYTSPKLIRLVGIIFLVLLFCQISLFQRAYAKNLSLEISKHYITVTSSYRGAEVLIFGSYGHENIDDIILTIVGPASQITLNKKVKNFGIWSNKAVKTYENIPGFFMQSSTRALKNIVSNQTIKDLKLNYDSYLPAEAKEEPDDISNLIQSLSQIELHQTGNSNTIKRQNNLFRLDNLIPANASPGLYSIRGYVVRDGEVVGNDSLSMWVKKDGFSDWLSNFAKNHSFYYGLIWAIIVFLLGFAINFIKIRKFR